MKLRKTLVILMALIMLVGVVSVACTPKTAEPAQPAVEEPAAEEPAAEEPAAPAELSVAVFYYDFSDAYISTVRDALNAELDTLGVKYDNQDGANDQTKQNEQIDTALANGANVLIVNMVSSGATDVAETITSKAKEKDAKVIFFNRALGLDNGEKGLLDGNADTAVFVGTDAPEAGHLQGKMIGDYLLADYDKFDLNGDGKISYAMFMGDISNQEAIARTKYGQEDADAALTAAGKPALEYFDSANKDKFQVDQQGKWSAEAANAYMTTNLANFSEANKNMIELIICNNDGMATGVISALNDKGYNTGEADAKTIPVFGVDATEDAKALIDAGKMAGTVKQDSVGMAKGIAFFVQNLLDGKALTDGIDSFNTDPDVATKVYIPYAPYPEA